LGRFNQWLMRYDTQHLVRETKRKDAEARNKRVRSMRPGTSEGRASSSEEEEEEEGDARAKSKGGAGAWFGGGARSGGKARAASSGVGADARAASSTGGAKARAASSTGGADARAASATGGAKARAASSTGGAKARAALSTAHELSAGTRPPAGDKVQLERDEDDREFDEVQLSTNEYFTVHQHQAAAQAVILSRELEDLQKHLSIAKKQNEELVKLKKELEED